MLIATFGPNSVWPDKTITFEDGQFLLDGQAVITLAAVWECEREGQLLWANDGTRAWVGSRALSESQAACHDPTSEEAGEGVHVQAPTADPAAEDVSDEPTVPHDAPSTPDARKPSISKLYETADTAFRDSKRLEAVRQLGTIGSTEAIEALATLLCRWGMTDNVRAAIAKELSSLGDAGLAALAGVADNKRARKFVEAALSGAPDPVVPKPLLAAGPPPNEALDTLLAGNAEVLGTLKKSSPQPGKKVLVDRDTGQAFLDDGTELTGGDVYVMALNKQISWASKDVERDWQSKLAFDVATLDLGTGEGPQTVFMLGDGWNIDRRTPLTAEELVIHDRAGRIAWFGETEKDLVYMAVKVPEQGASRDAGQVNEYARLSEKARAIYDANGGPRAVDFVIEGLADQYLVALADSCVIVKPGLLAGAMGGGRFTEFPYADITGVEVNSGILNAVLEVTTPAYQGKAKDFWRMGRNSDPFKVSNCLPGNILLFNTSPGAEQIEELRRRVRESKRQGPSATAALGPDPTEQLERLAALREKGLLTDAEFTEAKRKILGAL